MRSQRQSTPSARRRQRRRHKAASALSTFPLSFGKHAGRRLMDVPLAYLRWMLKAENVPAADLWAAERYLREVVRLRRRRPGRRQPPRILQETITTPPAALGSTGRVVAPGRQHLLIE